FNMINTILLFPFGNLLIKAAEKLVPGYDVETERSELKYLDSRILETPSIALGQVAKEVYRMAKIVEDNFKSSYLAFVNKDEKLTQQVFSTEKIINQLETDILQFLVKLSNKPLNESQHVQVNALINMINDIERVGDHADNMAELSQVAIENNFPFSDIASKELENIFNKNFEAYKNATEAFHAEDFEKAKMA